MRDGSRASLVRADQDAELGQRGGRGQSHTPTAVRLGGHAAALTLAAYHPAHEALAHPEARRHFTLAAFPSLARAEHPLAQVQ